MFRRSCILLLVVATGSLIPCPRRVQAAEPVAAESPQVTPLLNGTWSGRWCSRTNGHQGPITARFCQLDACHYEVKFTGRFLKVLPFCYRTTLTVTGVSPGRVTLQASERLGPLLGTFTINAWASDCQFVAAYSSKDDQGQFVMSRVDR